MGTQTPMTLSELARRLVKARKIVEGRCRVCGKEFTGAPNRRYCSGPCRWYFYRHRMRQSQFSLPYELTAVYVGGAHVYLDEEGLYWLQLRGIPKGPAVGDPGRPEGPESMTLDVSYRAVFGRK
jgi:predicted nucleic acid-binding Zn ribbon protein